jgi:uncharacterized protein YecT (DUF1311 family)
VERGDQRVKDGLFGFSRRLPGLTGALFLLGSVMAFAQPAPGPCWDKATTQADLTGCAAQDMKAADDKLNKSYHALICLLDPAEKGDLKKAQRAWLAFRDADCAFWRGQGSIAAMNFADCMAERSNARAKELDSWPPNAPRDAVAQQAKCD